MLEKRTIEKKNLIIIKSVPQIFIAIAIRLANCSDEYFDAILCGSNKTLRCFFERKVLDNIFDNIYIVDDDVINYGKETILSVIFTQRYTKNIVTSNGNKLGDDYTDIFFWNANKTAYIIMAYCKLTRGSIHVICDAFGGYLAEGPDDDRPDSYQVFYKTWCNYIFKKVHSLKELKHMDYDYYMFKPILSYPRRVHNVKEVPVNILKKDSYLNCINDIFEVQKQKEISQKFIFMGNVPGEFTDENIVMDVVQRTQKQLGYDKFGVKAHPRTPADYYKKLGINEVSWSAPWDVYCMNYDISNKIIISGESSSVFLPTFLYEKKCTFVLIRGLLQSRNKEYNDEIWKWYVDKLKEYGCIVFEADSIDDYLNLLEQLDSVT